MTDEPIPAIAGADPSVDGLLRVEETMRAATHDDLLAALRDYAAKWLEAERSMDAILDGALGSGSAEEFDRARVGLNSSPWSLAYSAIVVAIDCARALSVLWADNETHFAADFALLRAGVECAARAAWVTCSRDSDVRLNRSYRLVVDEFQAALQDISAELASGNPMATTSELRARKRELLGNRSQITDNYRAQATRGWSEKWKNEVVGMRSIAADLKSDLGLDAATLSRTWRQLSSLSHGSPTSLQTASIRQRTTEALEFSPDPERVFVYAVTFDSLFESAVESISRHMAAEPSLEAGSGPAMF